MISQILSFIAGFAALVLYMGVFLALMRLRLRIGWFALQIICGIIIHVLSSLFFYYILQGFLYWYALGIFSVGWFCFFTLGTAIYVSISARILRTINKQPGQSLPLDDIFQVCIREPFNDRAEFLVASGLAQKGANGYRITDIGEKNARRVQWMRLFFGMEGSGLYVVAKEVGNGKREMK
jgi:hypothetical protein